MSLQATLAPQSLLPISVAMTLYWTRRHMTSPHDFSNACALLVFWPSKLDWFWWRRTVVWLFFRSLLVNYQKMSGKSKAFTKEEELLLQDFSRNVSTKSSALFYGNAFIVSAIPICEYSSWSIKISL